MRVGINGFGRIGRSLARMLLNRGHRIAWINDLNPSIDSVAYLFNYDSLYGARAPGSKFEVKGDQILANGIAPIAYTSSRDPSVLRCEDIDVLLDSSGNSLEGEKLKLLTQTYEHLRIVATHDHPDAEAVFLLGVNSEEINQSDHRFVSSGTCDATGLAPILKIVDENWGIESGHITTAHPALSYQNVLDGVSSSWSTPGNTYGEFGLGRSTQGNLIPKSTSTMSVVAKCLPDLTTNFSSFSYRVPTQIVSSAAVSLVLRGGPDDSSSLIQAFHSLVDSSRCSLSDEPLVSIDFLGREEPSILDSRWTQASANNLFFVIWYDNELGYCANTVAMAERLCEPIE